jgi:putative membrane protein
MDIIGLLLSVLVTSISLLIISKLPTGVEIDNIQKAGISAIVFGLLNALVRPILRLFTWPLGLIFSSFLIGFLLNMAIFALAAYLVEGFRLRWGFWSALIGSFALSLINSFLFKLIG